MLPKWKRRWVRCSAEQGGYSYFEGDSIQYGLSKRKSKVLPVLNWLSTTPWRRIYALSRERYYLWTNFGNFLNTSRIYVWDNRWMSLDCRDNHLLNWYINIYFCCAEYTDELRFEELKTNNIVPAILLLASPTPLSLISLSLSLIQHRVGPHRKHVAVRIVAGFA
jgi:hypothetical protein